MDRFHSSNRSTTKSLNSLSASSVLSPDPVLIDPCVKSSFGVLLKLQKVIRCSEFTMVFTHAWTGIPRSQAQARSRSGAVGKA